MSSNDVTSAPLETPTTFPIAGTKLRKSKMSTLKNNKKKGLQSKRWKEIII